MEGLILNENTRYHTNMKLVLDSLGKYVEKLNWRITWMQIGCIDCDRLFDNDTDVWISGKDLKSIVDDNPNGQWIWGLLQGFDSSMTIVVSKDLQIIENLRKIYTRSELLSKYNQ